MGKKDKKKGKGAEKTALKTEKKALNKIKKDLASKGEDDLEKLIADFQEHDRKRSAVSEEACSQPSPRSGFNFCGHPDKEELILFGGEYFNGSKTVMYNDLYLYNIKKGQWSVVQCPTKPPPRCSAQAVSVPQSGGQLWVFGGEFASPTRSQFHHYRDLWVFSFADRVWQQVKATGGPSARSGHRMVATKKNLIVFGGFHETIRDYKYFNDVHIFSLESYTWSKIEPVGKVPTPRSGCLLSAVPDGRVLVYGGYSREKVKKDVDKGITHSDMYYLQVDERTSPPKWKFVQTKPSGLAPSPRSGLSVAPNSNSCYAFGGVEDIEDNEEGMSSVFHNQLFLLELDSGRWQALHLRGAKGDKGPRKKRRKAKDGNEDENDDEGEEDCDEEESQFIEPLEKVRLSEKEPSDQVITDEDSIFTVKIGPSTSTGEPQIDAEASSANQQPSSEKIFCPKGRMNCGMVVKGGILYLYGGLFEDNDRQLTLSDFHSLDIHRLDSWKTVVPFSTKNLEWIDSEGESESTTDSEDEMEEDSSGGEEMDTH